METLQGFLLPAIILGLLIFLATPLGARLMARALKAMNLEAPC